MTAKQLYVIIKKIFKLLLPDKLLGVNNCMVICRNFARIFWRLRNRGSIAFFSETFSGVRVDEIFSFGKLPFKLKLVVTKNLLNYLLNFVVNVIWWEFLNYYKANYSVKDLLGNCFSLNFYSTMNHAGQIVHYRYSVWAAIEKHGFGYLKVQRMLVPITHAQIKSNFKIEVPIHKLRFIYFF